MNRKLILVFAIFATTSNIKGQVAKWLIQPMYDNIYMASGEDIVIADSANYHVLWTQDGKRLAETQDVIFPFSNHYSVLIKKGTDIITGFYDVKGTYTYLQKCNATYNLPYFYDQYLLIKIGDTYRFVNHKGKIREEEYIKAYPFRNGYASCSAYRNPQKQKDLYHLLLTKDYEEISFSFNDKKIEPDDIEFISSINDDNIGFVVANRKVYYFNGQTRRLSPVFAKGSETNIKNQAKLEKIEDSDTTSVLIAKCGKGDKIMIYFNSLRVPTKISLADENKIYQQKPTKQQIYESEFSMPLDNLKYAIMWGNDTILPPQFDDNGLCFGDKAFVKLNGKCGLLKIYKDEKFQLTINDGDPIGFKHKTAKTKVRLDIPSMISAYNTRINIDNNSGCDVDMTSAEQKDTDFGNYVQYNCTLSIPLSLPDEMEDGNPRNEIMYPAKVLYDGLTSPIIPLKVKAWHYKYFNVDIAEYSIDNHDSTLSFTFEIKVNPDDVIEPLRTSIQTDSLLFDMEKISETRYKCKVYDLKEGINSIEVQVLEKGCPPVVFPFDVTYTKPVAKTDTKQVPKKKVEIKKRVPKTSTPKPATTPHLDI